MDLSPEMIRRARELSAACPNIDFQTAEIQARPWPESKYDCIASIAAFHHLPLEETLRRCADALAPGGILLVLDLDRAARPWEYALGALALPFGAALRFAHTGSLRESPAVHGAWIEHGRHERYPALAEVHTV